VRWLVAAAFVLPATAAGFGAAGHSIAGRAAASHLCRAATAEVGLLAGGEGLDDLGQWADRVRRTERYEHTGSWHYLNIDDGLPFANYESPAEGDVITAAEQFHAVLAEDTDAAARAVALRFLVHFIVDIHQPLHAGRGSDLGGNTIAIVWRGETMNLHAFWDTAAITANGQSIVDYARAIAEEITPEMTAAPFDPRGWAEESYRIRDAAYEFADRELTDAYIERAASLTRDRLMLAGARLAATLNNLYCQ